MKSISIYEIREALRFGEHNGYILFPEIREKDNIAKIKNNPLLLKAANDWITYANSIADEPPKLLPFFLFIKILESGNRLNYEQAFFEGKNRLHALVMAEILEDNGKYINAINDHLWQLCDIYTWELPAHVPLTVEQIKAEGNEADVVVALFSAETGFYCAEILSLIGDKLNPLVKYRLNNEIFRRVINSYKNRHYSWEEARLNWASVCAGAVGCACLYLIKDTNELSILISRIIAVMESALLAYDKDGVTTEGLGYWNYGFSFFVYFSELLNERTCGRINLLANDEHIKKIAELPLNLQFPDGHMVNFSDTSDDKWDGDYGLLCRLSKELGVKYRLSNNIDIFKDHTSKWAVASRNLFWSLEEYADDNTDINKIGMFYFPEAQWLIDRRIASDNKFYAFAAKGGHNDEAHNHNDIGHFILHYNGENLLVDLGAPEYIKQYFSGERYNFLHASSKGHSVPIINGQVQPFGKKYHAEILQCNEQNGTTLFKLDMKKAYDINELITYNRTFIWNYAELALEIKDEFKFDNARNCVEEVFVTKNKPSILRPGAVLIQGNNGNLCLTFAENAACDIITEAYTNHFGKSENCYRIIIKYNTDDCEIFSEINITINC